MQALPNSSPVNTSVVDHLVVLAASLEQGCAWSERVLGVTPGPGGEHPLMGSHNRLINVSGPAFGRSYVEIIAIQPGVAPHKTPGQKRWFDMDDPVLEARVAREGPLLIHFVVAVSAVAAAAKALAAHGLDRGHVVQASRQSAAGLLGWRITVRDDGQRLFYGGLPSLIEWTGTAHPADAMAASGVTLEALEFSHPRPDSLTDAYAAIGLTGVTASQGAPSLKATLMTPHGRVVLESKGA
jgi:Glyoxalase-like domain